MKILIMKKVSSVKGLRLFIDNAILPNYKYKTNLSSPEFLVDIDSKFIIIAKPICDETKFYYEFMLNTEFLSNKEITYDEIVMIKNIIEILEENRCFVLSRLKKYTVSEYKEELRVREENSERMLETLKQMIVNNMNK